MVSIGLVAVLLSVVSTAKGSGPEQLHISYGDDQSQIVIMWATSIESSHGVVQYGPDPANLELEEKYTNVEFSVTNEQGTQNYHRAKLQFLEAGTLYFYQIYDGNITTEMFNFTTIKNDTKWAPNIMVFGDLGTNSPFLSMFVNSTNFTDIATIIHVGDIGFDLHGRGGKTGDEFLRKIQPVASTIPYMTCPGDHELSNKFSHYSMRFSMPGTDWPMPTGSLWYSFNVGKIHFVSYSTEVYFDASSRRYINVQKAWLIHDLEKANASRSERPWIIAFGHRPMYCSNTDYPDCDERDRILRGGLEDIFYKYGVDLVIQAHEHSYERTWPLYRGHVYRESYYEPNAPIHVINGAAGSDEGPDKFKENKAPWSALQLGDVAYGSYGLLKAYNDSHLKWIQKSFKDHSTLDSFWIVQYEHGTFPRRMIPWFDAFTVHFQMYIVVSTVVAVVLFSLIICLLSKICCRKGSAIVVDADRNRYQPLIQGSGKVQDTDSSDDDIFDENTLFKRPIKRTSVDLHVLKNKYRLLPLVETGARQYY